MSVLVIGAAGAVGKRLIGALASRGERIVAVDKAPELPESIRHLVMHAETNKDVRDFYTMQRIFQRHRFVHTVWNLAAPLSVETARNPKIAEQVTINGMRNVLWAMYEARVKKSLGSRSCTARWLTEHPMQDPGSDYGRQKRGVRRLLKEFWNAGGDPRWAYALEALLTAANCLSGKQETFQCPIEPTVRLPMIYVDDLTRGLLALQDADESQLREPERGYALPGVSFTAEELFKEIRFHVPSFEYNIQIDQNLGQSAWPELGCLPTDSLQPRNMNTFANLWPDTLSTSEPLRDLGYQSSVGFRELVFKVLIAHRDRLMT
eukprot:g27369.t1